MPVNVGRAGKCVPALCGMFGSDAIPIQLKVMVYTEVGCYVPCWKVKCVKL